MKKILAALLVVAVLIMPMTPMRAEASVLNVLNALSNLASLEDFKALQSFGGRMEVKDEFDHLSIAYRVSFNSVVDNDSNPSSFSRVNLYAKIFNHNELEEFGTPFKELVINANGEVIMIDDENLYLKLGNVSLTAEGADEDFEQEMKGVMAMFDAIEGTWYHDNLLDTPEFSEFAAEPVDLEPYVEFEEEFQEDPEMAINELVEHILENEASINKEEADEILEGLGLLLADSLFNQREIASGRNEGFKFFSLNRAAVVNLFVKFGELINEPLSDSDLEELRDILGQFTVSGIYRIDPASELLDNFFIRFRLNEVEPFKNFEMGYRFKLTDTTSNNSISAPKSFESMDSLEAAF